MNVNRERAWAAFGHRIKPSAKASRSNLPLRLRPGGIGRGRDKGSLPVPQVASARLRVLGRERRRRKHRPIAVASRQWLLSSCVDWTTAHAQEGPTRGRFPVGAHAPWQGRQVDHAHDEDDDFGYGGTNGMTRARDLQHKRHVHPTRPSIDDPSKSTSELAYRERPRHPRSVWTLAVAKQFVLASAAPGVTESVDLDKR